MQALHYIREIFILSSYAILLNLLDTILEKEPIEKGALDCITSLRSSANSTTTASELLMVRSLILGCMKFSLFTSFSQWRIGVNIQDFR